MVKAIVALCNFANASKHGAGSMEIKVSCILWKHNNSADSKDHLWIQSQMWKRCGTSKKEMGIVKFEQAEGLTIERKMIMINNYGIISRF